MSSDRQNTARLDARLPPAVLDLIKSAAELQGRSLSEFVVGSAREAAEKALESRARLQLSLEDQEQFAKALLKRAKVAPALRRAQKVHAKLIDSNTAEPKSRKS